MKITEAYPLSWPVGWKRTAHPIRSRFGSWNDKPSVAKASNKVLHEIELLGGSSPIISSNMKLKKDGFPYSKQPKMEDMGIAVYFTWEGEQKVIACDSYDLLGCNLWAIAKTIEAMRGIDRWGCSEILNRAFAGFKALPEKASEGIPQFFNGLREEGEIKSRFRELAFKYHPDTGTESNPALWTELNRQRKVALSIV